MSAKQTMSGSISGPNEPGPYHYGQVVTFSYSTEGVRGSNYPMIALYLFQDKNADGTISEDVLGPDLGSVSLDHPDAQFGLGGGSTEQTLPSKALACLYSYGWKAKQESIVKLDEVEFDVTPAG